MSLVREFLRPTRLAGTLSLGGPEREITIEETPMVASACGSCTLIVLLLMLGTCPAADEPSWRAEVGKAGKAATALVEVKARGGYGSAFCIHPSGLFLTNAHVVQPDNALPNRFPPNANGRGNPAEITLVVNPGLKTEKTYAAKVVRSDKGADLALLRIDGVKGLPALSLGSDAKLTELDEVVACGFPFGMAVAPGRKEYPSVSINAGSITSLRRKDDRLHRIQLDVALNPGNSGGPVLDKSGKVVGVVVSGIQGAGVNFAVPVGTVADFVARPEVQFEPPVLDPANLYKPVAFEVGVIPILPTEAPLSVDLALKPARGGKERTYHLEATAEGKYRTTAVPLPPPQGALTLRLLAQFDNGTLNATVTDRAFKIGDREAKLSEVRAIRFQPKPQVLFHDGKRVEGEVTGLEAVPVQLGDQSLAVNLARAAEVKLAPAAETDQLWYVLRVRQGDKEIFRESESILVQGLLPTPAVHAGASGIKPPTLEAEKVERKLTAAPADVAVGGAGRYLVLHLPKAHELAVFDVSAADFVGHIPVKEEGAKFAAGLEDVVVLLPAAGSIERWSLKTCQRDVAAKLPITGVIKAVAMGSSSKGPLLVHSAQGTEQLSQASYSLLNVETLKPIEGAVKVYPSLGSHYQDIVHLRASANGKVFGLWCTSHSPSGLGTIVLSDADVKTYYMHNSVGYVLPSPDGKIIYTATGKYPPEVQIVGKMEAGEPMIPAYHGDYYLKLPPAGKQGAATVHAKDNAKAIATLTELDLSVPREDWIKHDMTFDKRILLIPEARLIVTIPLSDDRLVLHRFGS
jgi:hypothetical protein